MSRGDGKVVNNKQWTCKRSLVEEGLDVTLDWSGGMDAGSWWIVGCKCVIHQGVELRYGLLAVLGKLNHKWLEGWSDTHASIPLPCIQKGGCQLLTIQVQWQPKWRVISYWQYEYNDDLSEGLSVIDDTNTMTTWVKGCQLSTIRVQWRPEWKVASYW